MYKEGKILLPTFNIDFLIRNGLHPESYLTIMQHIFKSLILFFISENKMFCVICPDVTEECIVKSRLKSPAVDPEHWTVMGV